MEETSRVYRPTAAPRPVAGVPAPAARGPEPVRRGDPLAPQPAPRVPLPARGPDSLAQLGQALSAIQPGLTGLLNSYFEGQRQVDGAEAEAAAAGAAAHINTWADAVRENPALADRSPYFRNIYEGRLARTAIQRRSNQVLAEYLSSEVAGSEDPNAIFGFLQGRYQGVLDGFRDNPVALQAATEELRQQSQQLARTHASRAAENLVQRNVDSWSSAVGTIFDQAAQRGWSIDQIGAELDRLQAEARAQGLDGRTINRVLIGQTEEAIVRTGRTDLAALGARPRADGTPGYGQTVDGRNAMRRAEDRVMSRRVQAANLAYTQMMRQREEAIRTARTQAADFVASQYANGQDPTLPPEMIQRLARADMQLARQAMEFTRDVASFGRRDNAPVAAALEMGVGRGEVDGDGLFAAFLQRQISSDTFSRLYRQYQDIRQDGTLNQGAVQNLIEEAQRIVGDPSQMGGIFRRPQEAAALGMTLRESVIRHRRENPTATLGDTIEFLQREVERLVPLYAPGKNLERLRLDRVQADGLPDRRAQNASQNRDAARQAAPQPRAPAAPQEAQTLPPSRDVNWQRTPVFATREELQAAYQAWLRNPTGDPNNPIAQWVVNGGVDDPATFVQRQMGLIPPRRTQSR